MARSLSLSEFFEDNKYPKQVLAVAAVLFLLLELAIFIAVYSQSGLKSKVTVVDSSGRKIYESPGSALSSYEKMVFENDFGPLKNYTSQVESEQVPFDYRAWILLAVGMPLGLILMLFFMAQAWLILLNGSPKEEAAEQTELGKGRLGTFLSVSKNFSILGVGFIIVLSMLILWLIPSILGDVADSFLGAVKEYPWFFAGAAAFVGGLLVWVIYLRYKLSKQLLENQMEIEKCRIQQQLLEQNPVPHLLAARVHTDETQTQLSQQEEH